MLTIAWILGLLACDDGTVILPVNDAPAVVILAPSEAEEVDSPVAFTARLSADDAPLAIAWESDWDGVLEERRQKSGASPEKGATLAATGSKSG